MQGGPARPRPRAAALLWGRRRSRYQRWTIHCPLSTYGLPSHVMALITSGGGASLSTRQI